MPIEQSDIEFRLSGGAENTDPDASLGGAISNTAIADAQLHNLFDRVSGAQSAAGHVDYRCLYVRNGHETLTWEDVAVWIQAQTPSEDTIVHIGLDPAGVNGTATTIADEETAPAGVTFSAPDSESPLEVGNIPAEQHIAVWVRRTVSEEASAFNNDGATLRAEGDTAA